MAHNSKSQRTACHAHQFVHSLSASQRNALRVIMVHADCCKKLQRALGTEALKPISREEHATGLARAGRTIALFTEHAKPSAQHIAVTE